MAKGLIDFGRNYTLNKAGMVIVMTKTLHVKCNVIKITIIILTPRPFLLRYIHGKAEKACSGQTEYVIPDALIG